MIKSKAESFINENIEVLSELFDQFTDMVFLMSVEEGDKFRYQGINHAAVKNAGMNPDVTGLLIEEVVDPDLASLLNEKYRECANTQKTVMFECRHSGEQDTNTETVLTPIFDSCGNCTHIVAVTRDVTERKRMEQQLRDLAFTDSLTNLPNRRGFQEVADALIRSVCENEGSFAVIFLDCDLFKQINDDFGHSVGDEFLITFAQRIKHSVRDGDIVARMGGDEFIVLLPSIQSKTEAEHIAERLLKSIRQPWLIGDRCLNITSSLGIAIYPFDGKTTDDLLKHADLAMYKAKAQGRNGFRFFCRNDQGKDIL